jgi:hypothetical protein
LQFETKVIALGWCVYYRDRERVYDHYPSLT